MTVMTEARNQYPKKPADGAGKHPENEIRYAKVTVDLAGAPTFFDGFKIAWVSTRDTVRQLRWTELTLYWLSDVPGSKYALVNAGRSAQYHLAGGDCNTGVPVTVGSLDDNDYMAYQACGTCRVKDLDDFDDDGIVNVETTRNGITTARNAAELIKGLRRRNPRRSTAAAEYAGPEAAEEEGFLSMPAYRLLVSAAVKDQDIQRELMKPRKLK